MKAMRGLRCREVVGVPDDTAFQASLAWSPTGEPPSRLAVAVHEAMGTLCVPLLGVYAEDVEILHPLAALGLLPLSAFAAAPQGLREAAFRASCPAPATALAMLSPCNNQLRLVGDAGHAFWLLASHAGRCVLTLHVVPASVQATEACRAVAASAKCVTELLCGLEAPQCGVPLAALRLLRGMCSL
eukprot:m51a1_g1878 hypothetical protein (186) ;mRNA; r:682377-683194